MKKLEDIPKKNIFEVPDGYFDRLPGRVQARISDLETSSAPSFSFFKTLRYALPVILLMVVGIFWYQSNPNPLTSMNAIGTELDEIQPDQLEAFLDDRDLSTEELVETVTWSSNDLQELENSVYAALDVSNHELEKIIDEYDEL